MTTGRRGSFHRVSIRVERYLLVFWPTAGYYVCSGSGERGASDPQLRGVAWGSLDILGLFIRLSIVRRRD
ncbi:hypothetical protein DU504_06725 [Haloplanus salinus]|uniref:Uncharacterized protein n=1 Tax=Haloplanus salinus TaxID=1126245 RepID=A0A368NBU0_9EURY|nr:hypothetical protein DU504_06725 [Haloplanus salinus]